ncbi:hypothetical protein BASA81_008002 [Batrachochytrium salamandrivorans]|nr:hypothetical protein BASA81_008002 [Batrachochytrium salamandrivorans]
MDERRFGLGHSAFVRDIALDGCGRRMASCAEDCSVRVHKRHPNGYELIWESTLEFKPQKLAWSRVEYGALLACAGGTSVVVFEEYRPAEFRIKFTHRVFKHSVTCLQFSPDGGGLIIGLEDGQVSELDLVLLLVRPLFQCHQQQPVSTLAVVGRGGRERVVVCGGGDSVQVWVLGNERWRIQSPPLEHKGGVTCVAMGLWGMIASAGGDGACRLWDVNAKGEYVLVQVLQHDAPVASVLSCEWNTAGTMLCTNADDSLCRLWAHNDLQGEWQLQVKM